MITRIIRFSITNRVFVLLAALVLAIWGTWAVKNTPVDALPDLSDVQVIVRTNFPGQAPQIVENQVTYPLTTTMLSVPGVKAVRGYSFFGDSFVYVIFDEHTDLYWARSRVLEYLNQIQGKMPADAKSSLGPDATGVGWIYEYALVDPTGQHDLSQLRSVQDWFLKYELKTLPNVAEVATIGGMVKQYQVVLNPSKMASLGITQDNVIEAIQKANQETGGSVLEMAETEYMVRATGYLKTLDDFRQIPLRTNRFGVPVTLGDIATIQLGPEMRRGISELNGQGETVGGVVILRAGKNARETIAAVKVKLAELQQSLPKGVQVVPVYDRSQLIDRAIENLSHKLIEEFIVVALVCGLFLWHLRSAMVAIVSLPLGILSAFLVMYYQGLNANIMSLGGIAIAIGADGFRSFLAGAHAMDRHFAEAPLAQNLPVRLGLLDLWYRNFHGFTSRCIAPYSHNLRRLPAYLQQLEMESNGKGVDLRGQPVAYATTPVIWGEPGTNGQHAFFEMIHQGPDVIPVEFIAAQAPGPFLPDQHGKLVANALAQARALMMGVDHADPHRACPGNRPSTFMLLRQLDPAALGALIALYEHRVFVCGALWGINPFDQWGVELGKQIAKDVTPRLASGDVSGLDASTADLIARLRS